MIQNGGYKTPKLLIDINGKPMFVREQPKADKIIFVCLKKHLKSLK